jgi:hypothetical protein
VLHFVYYYVECRYAECRYAECRYAECHYAECHYAESRYAECRRPVCHCLLTNIRLGRDCNIMVPGYKRKCFIKKYFPVL